MVKINKNMSFKYFYFKSDSIYLSESRVITFKPQKSRKFWIILLLRGSSLTDAGPGWEVALKNNKFI